MQFSKPVHRAHGADYRRHYTCRPYDRRIRRENQGRTPLAKIREVGDGSRIFEGSALDHEKKEVMNAKLQGKILVYREPSASGKTEVVASSHAGTAPRRGAKILG